MPKIDDLTTREASKRFKRSNYRPWNYMDEVEKEAVLENNININTSNCNNIINDINNTQKICNNLAVKTEQINSHKMTSSLDEVKKIEFNIETVLDKIFSLTGHQKIIFTFVVEKCISRGMLSTGIVKMDTLCEITTTSFKMVKLSIKRLIIKKLINRNEGKKGRGGFHSFSITEITRNAFLEYRRMLNKDINSIEKNHINSSFNDKKTSIFEGIPEEWKNINIELLKEIGFSENHLKQLYYKKLNTPDVIEESLKHFSFALLNNPKVKQYNDPLNVLMGVLRKGQAWVESNYKSSQEIAQRELLERKKAEIDRLVELEKEAYEVGFIAWQAGLSREELDAIIPDKVNMLNKSEAIIPKKVRLKMFFEKNVWPVKKKEYLIK